MDGTFFALHITLTHQKNAVRHLPEVHILVLGRCKKFAQMFLYLCLDGRKLNRLWLGWKQSLIMFHALCWRCSIAGSWEIMMCWVVFIIHHARASVFVFWMLWSCHITLWCSCSGCCSWGKDEETDLNKMNFSSVSSGSEDTVTSFQPELEYCRSRTEPETCGHLGMWMWRHALLQSYWWRWDAAFNFHSEFFQEVGGTPCC